MDTIYLSNFTHVLICDYKDYKNHSSRLIYEIVCWCFTAPKENPKATQTEENDQCDDPIYILHEAEVNIK